MIEWSNASKYNSFNSAKGLCYFENYRKILGWMDGKNELPPPVEVNLDPFAECNLSCYFCIVQRYLKAHREEVGEMRSLPAAYMLRLVDYLAAWGVRGLCISGGGEPSLHKDLPAVIHRAADKGMDVAPVSNMVSLSPALAEAIMRCRWLAMSVDAGDAKTYQAVKGRDYFDRVIRNISGLALLRRKLGAKVDLAFKFLVLPENIDSMVEACKLARDLGVQDFHVRPVDLERKDIEGHRKLVFDMEKIQYLFAQCHELETPEFRVFTVTHKFDGQFHNKQSFTDCLMTPLLLPILADGNAYLCVDKKMQERYRIGSCFPDPEKIGDWWGSVAHRALIKSVIPARDCRDNRCTGQCYNEQMEQVVRKDRMCVAFP